MLQVTPTLADSQTYPTFSQLSDFCLRCFLSLEWFYLPFPNHTRLIFWKSFPILKPSSSAASSMLSPPAIPNNSFPIFLAQYYLYLCNSIYFALGIYLHSCVWLDWKCLAIGQHGFKNFLNRVSMIVYLNLLKEIESAVLCFLTFLRFLYFLLPLYRFSYVDFKMSHLS